MIYRGVSQRRTVKTKKQVCRARFLWRLRRIFFAVELPTLRLIFNIVQILHFYNEM
jgi:hypothetical protein